MYREVPQHFMLKQNERSENERIILSNVPYVDVFLTRSIISCFLYLARGYQRQLESFVSNDKITIRSSVQQYQVQLVRPSIAATIR